MKYTLIIILQILFLVPCQSQEQVPDSTQVLDSVIIKAFAQQTTQRYTYRPVATERLVDLQSNKTSLVNGLNAIAGVRMEERSPGSYRINIRGSSLRSPFGVRNIKVYWNDVPVTDPSGNTYFNMFAWNNFYGMEVTKGPAASMYGAGTGGLILLNSVETPWKPGVNLEYITGSFNLQNVFVSAKLGKSNNQTYISYAHNQSDGYRVQSKMRRDNFSWVSEFKSDRQILSAMVLFTDMYYQTPGALTLAEYNANPKAARPAAGAFPSAVNAKAAIYQKNIVAALKDVFKIARGFDNTTTLYAAFTQIKNPAIRNYERRNEPSFGGRTVFEYERAIRNNSERGGTRLKFIGGAEFQQGYFNTRVSKNKNGNPDTLQTDDDVDNRSASVFFQSTIEDIEYKWAFNAGLSSNSTKIAITRLNINPVTTQERTYRNEIAPSFSVRYNITRKLYWMATAAKGFSPPTVAEVLPSTGVISTSLEAEHGWNYETTLRYYVTNRLKFEITGFYFKLEDALVQRRDLSGADFFVNAGDIQQKGIEFHGDYQLIFHDSFIQSMLLRSDLTFNHFRYGSFVKGTDDFSGNEVPSVPSNVVTFLTDLNFTKGIYFRANYYHASSIYLNDANTFKAEPYHLLGCQLGWKIAWAKEARVRFRLNLYAGADNLLDEKYSLGNDINAAANRFYNAAPTRNYYVGVSIQWLRKPSN